MKDDALLSVRDVTKDFPLRSGSFFGRNRGHLRAVNGVSMHVMPGETLGLVGETGCGKSTLARCVTRLIDVSAGQIWFDGRDITKTSGRDLRDLRRQVQIVFQDPNNSLNPRRRVGSIIADPFAIHGVGTRTERKRKVQELMELVGLNPEHYNRFPAEFSGGQKQRIGVARALALRPKLVVCDEPVSALDVSIQAQVINLLADMRAELGLTYVFISHDLSVVRHVSDRIAVMYLGNIVEVAPTRKLFEQTRHPYTRSLLSAVPVPDPDASDSRERIVLRGDVPSPVMPPSGCRFHPRCPKAELDCAEFEPALEPAPVLVPAPGVPPSEDHLVACRYPMKAGEDLSTATSKLDPAMTVRSEVTS
jgi:oligopeptide/dipeptide ABC transporter ATP-binding protein